MADEDMVYIIRKQGLKIPLRNCMLEYIHYIYLSLFLSLNIEVL